ncbi:Neuronal acetylcholine receptor subunit beta-3 [Nymphon striatum]|nr:Neuronal acetylcholine receptor subunit beta-3 [Nymphon striatum]
MYFIFSGVYQLITRHRYVSYERPAAPNSTTVVAMGIIVQHIKLHEDKQIMEIGGFLVFWWQADYLAWNPDDYGGIKNYRTSQSIWKPDVMVSNGNIDGLEPRRMSDKKMFVVIHNSGRLGWHPGVRMNSHCALEHTNFPFDEQQCDMYLGSWAYSKDELNLIALNSRHNESKVSYFEHYQEVDPEWKLKDFQEKRITTNFGGSNYLQIRLRVVLQRRTSIYVATLITPVGVGAFLAMLMFLLPQNHNQRITTGIVAVVILTALLIHLAWAIPNMIIVPKIVKVCRVTLIAVCASIVWSVILKNLSRGSFVYTKEPPAYVVNLLQRFVIKTVCLCGSQSHQGSSNGNKGLSNDIENKFKMNEVVQSDRQVNEWMLIGRAIDAILFVVFSITFMCITLG